MNTKRCSTCKTDKPLDDFYKDASQKDEKQRWCKECQRENSRRYRAKQKVKRREKRERDAIAPQRCVGESFIRVVCPGCQKKLEVSTENHLLYDKNGVE